MHLRRLLVVAAFATAQFLIAAGQSSYATGNSQVLLPFVLGGGLPRPEFKYVLSAVQLPQRSSDFAYDLNGDGRPDNEWGNIIGALSGQGMDIQGNEDAAVSSGTIIQLVSATTHDPALVADPQALTTLLAARPQTPDFTGGGHFVVDTTVPPARLPGLLATGMFSSTNSVTTTAPVGYTLKVALFDATPVELPLNGVHIQWTSLRGSPSALVGGRLNGSMTETDVQSKLVPPIAANLTRIVQTNPPTPQSQQVEAIFDTGGCTNPNGTIATAQDHVIDICEVATNSLMASLLAPDVQIYDANGHYAPNPMNTHPDSLSVGIGFVAVQAQY